MDDFVEAWKKDPGKLAIAGGSAGGTDQILAGLLAQAAGIDPKKVNYIAFSGGGEALAAILGGKVAAGISGVSEFTDQIASGKMRALAVSGSERVEGFDAPTAKEAGLDVELENWRGVVAPAGISDADKEALTERRAGDARLAGLEGRHGRADGWDDAYLPARRVRRLPRRGEDPGRGRPRRAGPGVTAVLAPAPARSHPLAGRAELGLAALLLALGVFLLVETQRIAVPVNANAVGPRFFPTVVGAVLVVVSLWLAVDVLRGGHGEMEAAEDVDVSRASDWRTLALLSAVFLGHAVPARAARLPGGGGAAVLRRRRRPSAAGAGPATRRSPSSSPCSSSSLFARGLGVGLPAGVLQGVL